MSLQMDPVRPDAEPRVGRRPGLVAVAGAAGGLIAVILGGIALATGIVDGHTTKVVEQAPPPIPAGRGGGLDAEAIYAREAPGVAFIKAYGVTSDTPFGQSQGVAEGSGFLVDRDGNIVTNAHVVDGADRVTVRFGGEGSTLTAQVRGKDDSSDLAVVHVDPAKAKVDPLPLGDSSAVHVGDPVVAIGNPFGLDRTITSGIVSALQRKISAPDGFTIDDVIQTDAAINPGNSGGPLIDAHGRVIGINSQIATGGSGDTNVGIGFAIPINTAKADLPALERGRTVAHPFLGVSTVTLDSTIAEAMGLPAAQRGALVEQVTADGPAAKAGLRGGDVATEGGMLIGGDVIVSLDGTPIRSSDTLAQAVAAHRAGQTVTLAYMRGGKRHVVRVRLGTRPGG